MLDAITRARDLIDTAHRADPEQDDGMPAELRYADRMEAWLLRLDPAASPLLRLAVRCQHLERWTVPRAAFPQDRAGYLRWRTSLYAKQGDRAQELLLQAGCSAADAAQVREWVAKTDLKHNAGSQALEDAACLVFLACEMEPFARSKTYDEAKWLDIIRKTWRKMSTRGQALAKTIALPPALAALVGKALAQD